MKQFISILWMGLGFLCQISAQSNYQKTLDASGISDVSIDINYSSLKLFMHDKNEIKIESFITRNGVPLNDVLETEYIKVGGTYHLNFSEDFSADESRSPDDMSGNVHYSHKLRITLPRSMQIKAHSVYGSIKTDQYFSGLHLTSEYGAVEAKMDQLIVNPDITMSSSYGLIDLTIPTSISARVNLSTEYGNLFSDLDIKGTHQDRSLGRAASPNQHNISTEIGTGEGRIDLSSSYGSIYIRKI